MAIILNVALNADNFVLLSGRTVNRAYVGTISVQLSDVGDASGGTVTMRSTWTGEEFGFRALVRLNLLSFQVSADPGNVGVELVDSGNARMRGRAVYGLDAVNVGGVFFSPEHVVPRYIISREEHALTALPWFGMVFTTNTNTATYFVQMQGDVFDAELLKKYGDYKELLSH